LNTQAQPVVTAELLKYQKRIKNRLKLMEKQKPKPKITQPRVGTALPVGAGFRNNIRIGFAIPSKLFRPIEVIKIDKRDTQQ